jgi:glycosyltransferase involved in cell wall biosynthesis
VRILDVSPQVVFRQRSGSQVRTANLLAALHADHEVRQFAQGRWRDRHATAGPRIPSAYVQHVYRDPIAALLTELSWRTWVFAPILSGLALGLRRPPLLAEWLRWADVTLVEFPWQFGHCRRVHPRGLLVLAGHNVEPATFASRATCAPRTRFRAAWLSRIERLERAAVTGADLVVAVSEEDRHGLVRRYGVAPDRIVVVPNGADTVRYQPTAPEARAVARRALGLPERPTVVFTASGGPANLAGLAWVRRRAARTSRFTFLVLGGVSPRATDGPLFASGPADDLAPYYRAGDLGICPIEFGGGTKIKLLETMAAGLPAVAFPETVRGLGVVPGRDLLVAAKNEDVLLGALHQLADDSDMARRVGEAGAQFVRTHHDWRDLGRSLGETLASLARSRTRSPGRRTVRDRRGP